MPWHVLDNARSAITEEGEALWPERWPYDALMAHKAELDQVDVLAWSQEYLNRPLPSETQMFDPVHWPTFTEMPDEIRIYQAWDLAISAATTADFTAGVSIAIDGQNRIYLVELRRGRWDFNRTQDEIVGMGQRYQALGLLTAVGIEAVAYQVAAVQEVMRKAMLPVLALRPIRAVPMTSGVNHGQAVLGVSSDKVSRARLLEARAAAGLVLRPEPAPPWWAALAEELAFFPKGAHDDQVDALAYAVQMAARPAAAMGGSDLALRFEDDGRGPDPETGATEGREAPAGIENGQRLPSEGRRRTGLWR